MEFSDLPNKDEIANAFWRITGEADPNKRLTPEEQQQAAQQQRAQRGHGVAAPDRHGHPG